MRVVGTAQPLLTRPFGPRTGWKITAETNLASWERDLLSRFSGPTMEVAKDGETRAIPLRTTIPSPFISPNRVTLCSPHHWLLIALLTLQIRLLRG